ncbi:hypothetical protein D3C73_780700 [compost metagenome]
MRGVDMPGNNGADKPLLGLYTARVEIRIAPLPSLRCEGEEGKGHLKVMLFGGLQKSIDGPHHLFGGMAVDLHDIAVRGPDAGTYPVDPGFLHLCHIAVPHGCVRQEQKLPRHIRGHISHAYDRQRTSILLEIVSSGCDRFTLRKQCGIIAPEALAQHTLLAVLCLGVADQVIQARRKLDGDGQTKKVHFAAGQDLTAVLETRGCRSVLLQGKLKLPGFLACPGAGTAQLLALQANYRPFALLIGGVIGLQPELGDTLGGKGRAGRKQL